MASGKCFEQFVGDMSGEASSSMGSSSSKVYLWVMWVAVLCVEAFLRACAHKSMKKITDSLMVDGPNTCSRRNTEQVVHVSDGSTCYFDSKAAVAPNLSEYCANC
ncbi:TPA: hypothetical protein ACH3X2_002421 [Trebouxia sp. C0005]